MGLCKDCRWWEVFMPEHQDHGGWCKLTEATNELYKDYPQSLAWAQADWPDSCTPVSASLTTLPDFGCVQFEAKA